MSKIIGHVSEGKHARADEISGTPAYMAPEAFLTPAEVDPRCDLYAMENLAYFLLTGTAPFVGDRVEEIMTAHVSVPPPPPATRTSVSRWRMSRRRPAITIASPGSPR